MKCKRDIKSCRQVLSSVWRNYVLHEQLGDLVSRKKCPNSPHPRKASVDYTRPNKVRTALYGTYAM